MPKLYECGICDCYHPWDWDGDCRDDANRFDSPECYAAKMGIDPLSVEVLSMEERIRAMEDEVESNCKAIWILHGCPKIYVDKHGGGAV